MMGEYEISQKYTLEDLRQTAAREYRQEPTGNWILNRNGTRKQETIGKEYIPTRRGKLDKDEWCRLMEEAIREEDKNTLLFQIETHCRLHCAWLHTDQDVHEYAMSCLSSGAYKHWKDCKEVMNEQM